jgi:TatD DNase family protein
MRVVPLIDSHAHLTKAETVGGIEEILQRAQAAGIQAIINICTDLETLDQGLQLAEKYPWIYNTAATTPHDVEKEGEKVFETIADHARKGHLVAIGETGLDYYYEHSNPEIQKTFLRRYLRLALECKLPVIIHCREAFKDFFQVLDEEYKVNGRHAPGVLHCFTGNVEEAEQVLKRGWYLSLSGIVTFKKSEELRRVAQLVPLEQMLIETDSPYLAPQSKRGKVNEPAYLPEIAEVIAQVKGIPLIDLAKATLKNATQLFRIKNKQNLNLEFT